MRALILTELPTSDWLFFIGIGYSLDPDFSFVKIAAPYAQVPFISTTILGIFFSSYVLLV